MSIVMENIEKFHEKDCSWLRLIYQMGLDIDSTIV